MNISDFQSLQSWQLWVLVSFLLGSLPFGLVVAKIFKVGDLRSQGSGNIGTTNVARIAGFWPAGFLTLVLDLGKGSFAAWFGTEAGVRTLSSVGIINFPFDPDLSWMFGFAAVFGHCFTPWLKFNGGKGVATGMGVICVLDPLSALVGAIFFGLGFSTSKVGAVGSLSGIFGIVIARFIHGRDGLSVEHLWAVLMIALIVFRHESNLDRLLNRKENVF